MGHQVKEGDSQKSSKPIDIVRWIAWIPLLFIVGGFIAGLFSAMFDGAVTRLIVYALSLNLSFVGVTYLIIPGKPRNKVTIAIAIIASVYMLFVAVLAMKASDKAVEENRNTIDAKTQQNPDGMPSNLFDP